MSNEEQNQVQIQTMSPEQSSKSIELLKNQRDVFSKRACDLEVDLVVYMEKCNELSKENDLLSDRIIRLETELEELKKPKIEEPEIKNDSVAAVH